MNKIVVSLLIVLITSLNLKVFAHHYHGSNSSRPVYLIQKDYSKNEYKFQNCTKHSLIKETTVYFYSNGTRNVYNNYTVTNSDGSLLLTDCSKINHIIYNNKHYFIFYKNKKYQLIDETGNLITVKKYSKMEEITPNRILVCFDKKYGIIDLEENTIIPIKYNSLTLIDKNIFLTKQNGYFGLIDTNNKVILPNEYDKIKILPEIFIIKKEGYWGFTNEKGKVLLPTEYNSIEVKGEYVIAKKNNTYEIFCQSGNKITNTSYKKIKLERNSLYGKLKNKTWQKVININ